MKLLLFLLFPALLVAQTYDPSRMADWSRAGRDVPQLEYKIVLDIRDFGGLGDATTRNDSAINRAFAALGGKRGVIYFPNGIFYFTSTITPPDSCVIRGNGATSTVLTFDLGGKEQDAIRIASGVPEIDTTNFTPTSELRKNAKHIFVYSGNSPEDTIYLRAYNSDSSLTISDWAYGSVGQIVKVKPDPRVIDVVNLSHPLRHDYDKLSLLTMRHAVGIECLRIVRIDSTAGQTTNIAFDHAANSWIRGIESEHTNFAHVAVSYSSNVLVEGSYFHDSYGFGDGGRGYGVVLQFSSSDCLVQNNIFDHLRHSILLQAGANGNVISYNYSQDAYWTQTALPTNSAGDIVLHGNYPFLNLFESNICQNIVIDDSHGLNGPFNTFFRNNAWLYGIVMTSASDSQNFVGNDITNTSVLMGNYILSGTGHLEYGNRVRGVLTPAGTSALNDSSYYRKIRPTYAYTIENWPSIGVPIPSSEINNAAYRRIQGFQKQPSDCNLYEDAPLSFVDRGDNRGELAIYPNPTSGKVALPSGNYNVYDISGNEVLRISGDADLSSLPIGTYFVQSAKDKMVSKVILVK
jgi:hypothetical protein